VGKGDLVFTQGFIHDPFMKHLNLQCDFLFQEKFGGGEPSNVMIDDVFQAMGDKSYKRIIAVGGGTVIDIGKLMALKKTGNALALFEKSVPIEREKELIIVPTTCGTGSEVTNISIAELKEKHTKQGLAVDELYADATVLVPEMVKTLPYQFFVASSIDALIHACESYVSPKATPYTELFSVKAIEMILGAYQKIAANGADARFEVLEDVLIASNFAGIAFGNAGVGAVHAMSYPLGANYHVAHGEANYQFFTEVFKVYLSKKPVGKLNSLNQIVMKLLNVTDESKVYIALEDLLGKLLSKKQLREYGMKQEEIELWTDSVIENQQRLLVNNYVPFCREDLVCIYKSLY
jgi:4-hydroxybutyrate dehydrogenase